MNRAAFRRHVETRLSAMGWRRSQLHWTEKSRLVVAFDNTLREIPLRVGMKKIDLEFQLGRLSALAEMMGMEPVSASQAAAIYAAAVPMGH